MTETLNAYLEIPEALEIALENNDYQYLVELYHPDNDDIFHFPQNAMLRYSTHDFIWQGLRYKGKLKEIPNMIKFIGKEFNTLNLTMLNVERGKDSASFLALNEILRGFRVAIRIVFKGADIEDTRLVWWGRLDKIAGLKTTDVAFNCSQELGNFSYEVATDKYGQACPLLFGRGNCLGTETLEEKSARFRRALELYGQGGCNRNFLTCKNFGGEQERFYEGQNLVNRSGVFERIEYVKKKFLWIFSYKKKNVIPVQWSSDNQESSQDTVVPIAFGRVQLELQPFSWADTGEHLLALLGACKGGKYGIEGFHNVQSRDANIPLQSVIQHLGTLGGVGTQTKSSLFFESGYNSNLAYLEARYASQPADQADDVPTTTSVIKAIKVPVLNRNTGEMDIQWTHNPVWGTRYFMTSFRYQVINPKWFNDEANQFTADYCYKVVEDDTNADIAVINNGEFSNNPYRYRASGRYNEDYHRLYEQPQAQLRENTSLNENLLPEFPTNENGDVIFGSGDIDWFPASGTGNNLQRTFLVFRYTLNLLINDTVSISDLLHSFVFPTFRGFLHFNPFGKIEIQCKRPSPNAYVRTDAPIAKEIPITNVKKLYNKGGYLIVGVGQPNAEIVEEKGIRYVNGCANTTVSTSSSSNLGVSVDENFDGYSNSASKVKLKFSGNSSAGERIELKFTESEDDVLVWDYVLMNSNENLEVIAHLFKARLEASPSFNEFWSATIPQNERDAIVITCETGYLKLKEELKYEHFAGEEVLRVVEVYENNKDEDNLDGKKDNIVSLDFNNNNEVYHAVKGTYISAIDDFRETEVLPRIAWDIVEQERNLNYLELDLRGVDNYRQAGWLIKSNKIDYVDGMLTADLVTNNPKAQLHQENDVVAVRYQTLEGVSYLPFAISSIDVNASDGTCGLMLKLYLSAVYDERVAQEETFQETTLTTNQSPTDIPPATISSGGYSNTRTGDGNADTVQNIKFEPKPYSVLNARYHTQGRDTI